MGELRSLQRQPRPLEPGVPEGRPTIRPTISPTANLALLMLRYAARIEPALAYQGRIVGSPREVHHRVLEPMVPVLFFACIGSAATGGLLILGATTAHVPPIIVCILGYPAAFWPVAIFLVLHAYFWYARLARTGQDVRIHLDPGDPLLIAVTCTALLASAAVGLVVYAVTGQPFGTP